jgi:preprotein translocase subunit SecG
MTNVIVSYIVPVVHVFACLFLIVVVLLQTGKGADMGAVFGGGSQTLFGSGGAGNLLTKLTTGTAIAFMITSLILSYAHNRAAGGGLLNRIPTDAAAPAAPTPLPATPNAAAPSPTATGQASVPVAPRPTATGQVAIPVTPKADAPAQPAEAPPAPAAPAPAAPAPGQ